MHACSLVLNKPKEPAYSPRNSTDLSSSFSKENMHNLRINISGRPKIMINLQDVHFGFARQCAQVELQNINIFSKKNHLGSFCRNGKQFI
jgi:hypothetical protein